MLTVSSIIGIIPNFYGFLNNMGVAAPIGVTRAYYFAYEIGIILSFAVYWLANWISPPPIAFPLSDWREPADYIRPEERPENLNRTRLDQISDDISEEKVPSKDHVRISQSDGKSDGTS